MIRHFSAFLASNMSYHSFNNEAFMILLITGGVGVGKTIITSHRILAIPKRPKFSTTPHIFGAGQIDGIFQYLDHLSNWQSLPDDAIVFCDDASKFIPRCHESQPLPQWVFDLSHHRHKSEKAKHSLDFYFVDLKPMLLDSFVLSLVSEHTHFYTDNEGQIHSRTWPYCVLNPDDPRFFDKATFDYYVIADYV